MKYAHEVISLMGALPGVRFNVRHIVNHVAPTAGPRQRASIRIGVHRVLRQLEESGQVESTRGNTRNGANAEYWWKTVTSSCAKPHQEPYHTCRALTP